MRAASFGWTVSRNPRHQRFLVAPSHSMNPCPASAYPIALGDWKRAYAIVDRTGTRLLMDPYTDKPWVKMYCTRRVGGGVVDFHAYKLLKVTG